NPIARRHYRIVSPTTSKSISRFQRCYFVYILASLTGTLYVGLTDDMRKRLIQHKSGMFDGFTKKYKADRLMYFETYGQSKVAEAREQQIKKFRREKKIALFAESNPEWKDLTPELFQSIGISRYARDFRKRTTDKDDSNFRIDRQAPKNS
ncbi:MAG TPA: GIY-YIG nuclease family protein, partial [Candidatus Angelobacter sp.]|nr:GIY-YIG nuclease family protein [Candidatus Angelobacter sp.]